MYLMKCFALMNFLACIRLSFACHKQSYFSVPYVVALVATKVKVIFEFLNSQKLQKSTIGRNHETKLSHSPR